MSTTYTPVSNNNPTSITIPADTDVAYAASVNVAFEALADKIRYVQAGNVGGAAIARMIPLDGIQLFNQPDFIGNVQGSAIVYCYTASFPRVLSRLNVAGNDGWNLLLRMPHQAEIGSIVVLTMGVAGTNNNPTGKASYRLYRYDGSTQTKTALSSATADAHTYGGGGNWLTTYISTTITPTTTTVVNNALYTYALEVTNPYNSGAGDSQMWMAQAYFVCTPSAMVIL